MDFFGKDKLSRLDEERQRRRQQRAEEALRRLEEVGKQTQQLVTNHQSTQAPTPSEATDASGRRPGGLSRVLYETATHGSARRGKKPDPRDLLRDGQAALARIDGAMATIQKSVVDATGAGLKGGLEEASKSVTDIVDHVASMASGTVGTLSPSANKNPLAQLMVEEQAEENQQTTEADEHAHEDHKHRLALDGHLETMKHLVPKGEDAFKELGAKAFADAVPKASDGVARVVGEAGEMMDKAEGVMPHEAAHVLQQIHGATNAAAATMSFGDLATNAVSRFEKEGAQIATSALGAIDPTSFTKTIANGAGMAVNALDPAHFAKAAENAGPLASFVANAANGALSGATENVVDAVLSGHAKDAGKEALRGAKDGAIDSVTDTAMDMVTGGAYSTVKSVAQLATNVGPAGAVGEVAKQVTSFDPKAIASNVTDALDPTNFSKLAGTLTPANLVSVTSQAIDNVTARLNHVAEQLSTSADIVSPRDHASGQASGKRQHQPIGVTKEWDAGSPSPTNGSADTRPAATYPSNANPSASASPSATTDARPAATYPSNANPSATSAASANPSATTDARPTATYPSNANPSATSANPSTTTDARPAATYPSGANPSASSQTSSHAPAQGTQHQNSGSQSGGSSGAPGAGGAHHAPAGHGSQSGGGSHAPGAHAGGTHGQAGRHAPAQHAGGHTGGHSDGAHHAGGTDGARHAAPTAGDTATRSSYVAAATANQTTGQAPPPQQPLPGTQTAPASNKPATERQAAVQPTTTANTAARNASPVTVGSGGQMQINAQPVATPPAREIDASEKTITQPNVTIRAEGQSAALPGMPADLAQQTPAPTAQAPTSAPQLPTAPATTSDVPASTRQVTPLPAVTPQPTMAERPAPPTTVTMPQPTATPLPASAAPAASTATPAQKTTSGATTAGAQSVPANAKAAPAPPPAKLPQTPMTPGTAAPQTPATRAPEPNIPPVRAPGGDGAPSPSGMVPQTANLGADRSNASSQLTAEAQTQSKVAPEAATQKQTQVTSQRPAFEQTKRSGDAPREQAVASSTAQGQTAAQTGQQQGQQTATSGNQQIQGQAQGATAERAQYAAMPPPAMLQQTSPSAMQAGATPAQAAVAGAAAAATAAPVMVNPSAVARANQAGATPSQLPPFDGARFDQIDQVANQPLPETNMAVADQAKQQAEQTYQQTTTQIDQLSNIQPPQINAPASAGAGTTTKTGQPTREAAIANIEQQVTAQAQAQGPAKMQEAAAPLQQEVKQHAQSAQQAASTATESQLQSAQQQGATVRQQPPPTTGQQAAAQAQPQYQAHQAEATAASQSMQQEIAGAQATANTAAQQAKGQRDQQVATAQQGYQQTVQGQLMPEYAAAQQQAKAQFDTQNQTAQQAMASEQQAAQQSAQQQTEQARAKADADIAQQHSQLQAQQQAANASHQQQMEAANQQHEAQMQQASAQMDADVASKQSEMHSQVSAEQARGQQEVDRHLTEGEQGYQAEIQKGEQQANAEKAKAEADARAKEQQAQAEKDKHSGGVFGKVVGWVQDRFNDLMNAAKSVLAAARDMIVSIMEKARQAAIAVLQKARQAAQAALAKVKSTIQGIISAAASAIRTIISACAQLVRNLIQNLANMLKSLVQALTTLLTTLVQAFQAAVNALLDGLIMAVSLINKDHGDKLRGATQKYRDAFNNAMTGLQSRIKAAGDALQAKIQQAADGAIAVVNAAEQNLKAAVDRVEQTLNNAVEAAYQKGAALIDKAFDAAEAVVNKAFEVAEAAVKAYFNAQIKALDIVQTAVNKAAEFVIAVADKVLAAVAKIAEAIVNLIPESWTKWFVDFWNGPWRSAIIIGLATVAAVAITVATCGAAGPVAMVLIAGLIGGTIAGGAYLGGEAVAREGDIKLSDDPSKGIYIPGIGYQKVKLGPDGKPVMPEGLTPEQQAAWEKNSQWALSNFNTQRDAEGNVTGYERKSSAEIGNYAVQEGMKGFGEGFISSAGAMGGSLAGGALAGAGFLGRVASNPIARQMISTLVENSVGNISQSLGSAWSAGFDAIAEGKSPSEAFTAAWKAGKDQITDPGNWVSALAGMGVVPLKTKALLPLLDKATGRLANQAIKTAINESADVIIDTIAETTGNAGGNFVSAYYKAIQEHKTPAQALEEAKKAANDAFSVANIVQNLSMNAAGNIANKQAERFAQSRAAARAAAAGGDGPVADGPHHQPSPVSSASVSSPTHHDTPDGNARTHRGGDDTTPHTTGSDSTAAHTRPPTGQQPDAPTQHAPHDTTETHRTTAESTNKAIDHTAASDTQQHRAEDAQTRRDQTPPRDTDSQATDVKPHKDADGQPVRADETKPHQLDDKTTQATTHDEQTRREQAQQVVAEARKKQEQLDSPPPLREQVDGVTGVDKGPQYEREMQQLRDFYRQQEIEAQQVTRVETHRVEQTIDPATGQPQVHADGTPKGIGIHGDYDVRRFTYDGQNLTQVTIKVHLEPGQGVTAEHLARVRRDAQSGIDHYYNQGHALPNGDRLNVNVEFVTNPADAHLRVNVEPGKGRADQRHWFVDSDPAVHAHELGHQMGLGDEYHDPNVVGRRVADDGSLMGNVYTRDSAGRIVVDPDAKIRERHTDQIGGDIDAAREGHRPVAPADLGDTPNAHRDPNQPDAPARRIGADDFEMANLAKPTNDPATIAKRSEFNTKMAEASNSAVDQIRAGKSAEEVYQDISRWRAGLEPDPKKRAKLEMPIADGDPNFDPFGTMAGKREGGVDTPESRQRQQTGEDIKKRFEGVNGDVIQNTVTLPDGTIIEGNRLHRGASADEINQRKGNKYGYDTDAEKLITETASPANQKRLHDAGIAEIDRLLGQRERLATASPEARAKAMDDFANAAYMLFQGPVVNRGSDSTIRVMLTASYTEIFGHPPRLPQDIDIRAYSKDQATFRAELSRLLLDQHAAQTGNAPHDNTLPAQPPPPDQVATAAHQKLIEILGPGAEGGDHAIRERLAMDTPVFRVQDAKLKLEAHASPFFDPSAYNLPHGEYEALYVSTQKGELEALRRKQGYFANGDVMHQTTLGELLANAGPGATIVQDAKFNASVLGKEEGGYIIVRKKDGSAVETKPREMTPAEIDAREERLASAQRLKDEATAKQRLSQQRSDADTLRQDSRSLSKELRAAGHDDLAERLADLMAPARLGGKETRLLTQAQIDAAAQQLASSGALGRLHELAATAPPELATKLRELAGRLESTYQLEHSGPAAAVKPHDTGDMLPQAPPAPDEPAHAPRPATTTKPDDPMPPDLQHLLRRQTAGELKTKAEKPDLWGPLATERSKQTYDGMDKTVGADQMMLVDGTVAPSSSQLSPEARAWLERRRQERAKQQTGGVRKVVVDGGGPTGVMSALNAYSMGHEVTIVEMRDAATLPILWNNRPETRQIMRLIDATLEKRVFDGKNAGEVKFWETLDADGKLDQHFKHKPEMHDDAQTTGDPRAIAGQSSAYQTQNKTEVNLMWDRLAELEAHEQRIAAEEGREPRIKILRGYEVKDMPSLDGKNRNVIVQKVEKVWTKLGADGKPELDASGKPIVQQPVEGEKPPRGWKEVRQTDGKNIDLGTPDDLLLADGAGSRGRKLVGAESVDVGPSANYMAGYFTGAPLQTTDADGNTVRGGNRLSTERARNGEVLQTVVGTGEHADGGVWGLPQVDPTLDFNKPESIRQYFGEDLSRNDAIRRYYKEHVARALGVEPKDIPDDKFELPPSPFTLQSHVTGGPAPDASNVRIIGDARGNSHFFASLGKVTGTGTHQMALRQYWQALQWGLDPNVALALLERRLDAGTRVWLKSGLPSLSDPARPGKLIGDADGSATATPDASTHAAHTDASTAQRTDADGNLLPQAPPMPGDERPVKPGAAIAELPRPLRINIGGEGERDGFVNLNPLMGNRRSAAEIEARGPLVVAGAERMPFEDGSVSEVVSRALPSVVLGQNFDQIAAELHRVLTPGGTATLHSNTGVFAPGSPLRKAAVAAGFEVINEQTAQLTKKAKPAGDAGTHADAAPAAPPEPATAGPEQPSAPRKTVPFSVEEQKMIGDVATQSLDAYQYMVKNNVAGAAERSLTPTDDPAEARRMVEHIAGTDVVDGHRIPPWFEYKVASGKLYRADERPIAEVFAAGFAPRGTHNSIGLHLANITGQYVSFTKRMQFARDWHEQSALQGDVSRRSEGAVFVVRGTGIDIDAAMAGPNVPASQRSYLAQSEVAIAGGVPASDVLGAYVIDLASPTGYRYVQNPAAGGVDEAKLPALAPSGHFLSPEMDAQAGHEAMGGDVALQAGDMATAEAHYKKVLELDPLNVRAVWGIERINAARENRAPRTELFFEVAQKSTDVITGKTTTDAAPRRQGSGPASTTSSPAPAEGRGVGHGSGDTEIVGRGDGQPGTTGATGTNGATPASTGATVTHETEYDAADGSAATRTAVGVGERVFFTADADGAWTATGGTTRGSGQQFTWTAPEAAGSVTVTFTPRGGSAVTTTMTVVEPTEVRMEHPNPDSFPSGTMGAGFHASVVFHPLNVSFAATMWKEDTGQAGEAATGYFTDKTLPTHDANPNWLGIGDGNTGPSDHAAFSGFPSPWSAGSFKWSIQSRWKLRSASTGHAIGAPLDQVCTLEGAPHAGRTTVTKGGARAQRGPSDGGGGGGRRGRGRGHGDDGPASRGAVGDGFSTDGATHQTENLGHEVGGRGIGFGEQGATAVATPTAVVAAPSTELLVDAGATAPGQMLKSTFLDSLEQQIVNVANATLGRLGSAVACPYIEKAFAKYRAVPAAQGLALLHRWVPATQHVTSAQQMIPLVLERVRDGVKLWMEKGTLPPDLAAADPALAAQAQAAASVQGIGLGSLDNLESKLGDGEPVDQRVARGVGAATGVDVSDARVHRGPEAAGMAAEQDATAFAVGRNVVMGSHAPAVGTGLGDLLLAHELAHVAQQKDAASNPSERKKQIGAEDQAAETDANKAAGTGLAALGNFAGAMGDVMRTGVQLQRCAGHPADTGLIQTDFKGAFLGKKVGSSRSVVIGVGSYTRDVELKAQRTLGAYDTEAAAIAVVKTNGKSGAVTVEGNKYVAYETDLGFGYRETESTAISPTGNGSTTHAYPPKLAPGVKVLISNELTTVRASQFDPAATGDQESDSGRNALDSLANPVAGYRQAFGDDKGDLNNIPDDKLIAAFHAALRDTALVVLNKSAEDVKTKQARFTKGGGGVSDTEFELMKKTSEDLDDVDNRLKPHQKRLESLNMSKGMTAHPGGVSTMYDKDIADEQKQIEQLQLERKVHLAKYPLLSRVNPAEFKTKTKDQMAGQLGGELPGILKDIETTKQNVADGKVNLWGVDQIVDATIAGFGLDENKRKVILDTKKSEAKKKTIESVVLAVFAIGFGIAAAFATGGAALFFAAGAFGLSTYDAMKSTEQYMIDKPASNVAEDKDGGFTEAPHWGWLVVAWVGVGLDAAQVASTVGKIARAEKTIAEGAAELSKSAKALGTTEEKLLAKLRAVAGDVDGATKISEAHKAAVAGRLKVAVDIDPKLVGDVRIYYEVDKATGRAIVKGLAAGPEATLAEVLAHERVLNMMRRYEGVTGRLRELWEKLLTFAGKSPKSANPFPPGSKGYESWLELQKIPDLVDATALKYKNGLNAASAESFGKDLEHLEEQARRHQKIIDEMALEGGSKFVANVKDSTQAALGEGYPLVDGAKSADEMLAKGYYYEKSAADPSKFEIVRKTDAVGPQLRVEFQAGKPVLVAAVERLESKITDAAQLARLRTVVTDDARLTKLYDAVRDANRLEQLLKDVGDVAKLEGLLTKVTNAADLERLLKVFKIAELEPVIANLKKPELLIHVLDHMNGENAAKMINSWSGAKNYVDKLNQFVERMAGGVGKELAEKTAMGANQIIIDSNTAIALAKDADPLLKPTMNAGEKARVAYVKGLPAGTELRVGNVTVGEAPAIGLRGIPIDVARESAEYKAVLSKLQDVELGTKTGFADRAVVADAFFASTEPGVVPKFLESDKKAVNALARIAGMEPEKLGGFPYLLGKYGKDGFKVTIGTRSILVVPVP